MDVIGFKGMQGQLRIDGSLFSRPRITYTGESCRMALEIWTAREWDNDWTYAQAVID